MVWSVNLHEHDENHGGGGAKRHCFSRIHVEVSRSCTIRNVAMMAGVAESVLVYWAIGVGLLRESVLRLSFAQ